MGNLVGRVTHDLTAEAMDRGGAVEQIHGQAGDLTGVILLPVAPPAEPLTQSASSGS